MIREPRSARILQRAIDRLGVASRANPPATPTASPVFSVEVQYPEGSSPWQPHDQFGALPPALEEVRAMVDPRDGRRYPMGTVVRITRGDRLHWLGISLGGEVVKAPPVPSRPAGLERSWIAAWEGEDANARWMLGQCANVPRPALTFAACACARLALPRVSPGDNRPAAVIELAERWASGESGVERDLGVMVDGPALRANNEAVGAARMMAAAAARDAAMVALPARAIFRPANFWADQAARSVAMSAFWGAIDDVGGWTDWRGTGGTFTAESKLLADEAEAASLREQAAVVRRFIPLGAVLVARLAPSARKPIARR